MCQWLKYAVSFVTAEYDLYQTKSWNSKNTILKITLFIKESEKKSIFPYLNNENFEK